MKPHQFIICDQHLTNFPTTATFEEVLGWVEIYTDDVTIQDDFEDLDWQFLADHMRDLDKAFSELLGEYHELLNLALPSLTDPDLYIRIDSMLKVSK